MSHDGEWFRAKLHDIRKTQADLTRFVGLDAATIVRVFKDERKVKIDELKLFSQFFQCTTLELLGHLGVDFVEGKKSTLSENDVDKDILENVISICMDEYLNSTDLENFDPSEISQIISTVYMRAIQTARTEFENKLLAADIIQFSRGRKK